MKMDRFKDQFLTYPIQKFELKLIFCCLIQKFEYKGLRFVSRTRLFSSSLKIDIHLKQIP